MSPSVPTSKAWLQQVPGTIKALAFLVPIAVSIMGTAGAVAIQYSELATDVDVDEKIEQHSARPLTSDPAKSAHPELSAVAIGASSRIDAQALLLDVMKEQNRRWACTQMKQEVSVQVAWWQTDRRKGAMAATAARKEYVALVGLACDQLDPAIAMDQVLDSRRPSWAR